jgi:hypothetical protein
MNLFCTRRVNVQIPFAPERTAFAIFRIGHKGSNQTRPVYDVNNSYAISYAVCKILTSGESEN